MSAAPYLVGLTGGIGSGKTTVADRFAVLGAAVVDTDAIAHELTAAGGAAMPEIAVAFGARIVLADGALDRVAMRRLVFSDSAAKSRLEAIVHPRVRETLAHACERATSPYAIAAIPLLAEVGGRTAYPWLQRILVVDVPEAVQLQRLLLRDGIDEPLARKMIDVQATRQQRLAIADDVLVNDGALSALDERVAALDRLYRGLAAG